jgi:hypothetical protein
MSMQWKLTNRRNILVAISFCVALLFACAPVPELIRDVETLPQQNVHYLNAVNADSALVSPFLQNRFNRRADSLFFLPWHRDRDNAFFETVQGLFAAYKNNPGWGENLRKRDASFIQELEDNAGLESFPNTGRFGITVAQSNLRVLPTNKPVFRDYRLPGEGFPFDYMQTSSIPPNTPVRIIHTTRDRSWVWVRSHIALGWLPARDVAMADSAFIRRWEGGRYVSVVHDDVPVSSKSGLFLFHAPLGSVFPKTGEDSLSFCLLTALADANRKALIVESILPKTMTADKPMRLSSMNIATVADRLIREPYGWGGMYQNRDCSAMIRDMLIPFGILLPRNGNHQAESGYGTIDLSGLGPEEKEGTILQKGVPFLTLLWLKGHIMLYTGQAGGKALVFQNIWGIRTKSFFGKEGRHIVGEAVVTTLSPGKEMRNADPAGDLLRRIQTMTFVVPPDSIRCKKTLEFK